MIELDKPYWYQDSGLAGLDFNREIVEAGTNEDFPDGALGIRCDDGFWCVAALPLEQYRNTPIEEIIELLWPDYVEQATFIPDQGTVELALHRAKCEVENQRLANNELHAVLQKVIDERNRLRADKSDIGPRSMKRLEATNNYFVRQYEHLLVAMAHEAVPREDELKGVCSSCGLLLTDRVHSRKWVDKRKAGFQPHFPIPLEFEEDVNGKE